MNYLRISINFVSAYLH